MPVLTQMSSFPVIAYHRYGEAGVRMMGLGRVVRYVFLILSLPNCLETLSEWLHGQDGWNWWSSGLPLYSLLAFVYAVAFAAATRITCQTELRFAGIYNVALASLLFLNEYLYCTIQIDWPGVNACSAARMTDLQNVVRSDLTSISIYAIFLYGALIVGRRHWVRHENQTKPAFVP